METKSSHMQGSDEFKEALDSQIPEESRDPVSKSEEEKIQEKETQEREKETTTTPEPKSKTPIESSAVEVSSSEPPSEKKRKRIPNSEPRKKSQRFDAATSSQGGESKSRGDLVLTHRRYDSFFRMNSIDERRLINPEEV
ncbi:unnamed protein product [Cochlearia groenlandica]